MEHQNEQEEYQDFDQEDSLGIRTSGLFEDTTGILEGYSDLFGDSDYSVF